MTTFTRFLLLSLALPLGCIVQPEQTTPPPQPAAAPADPAAAGAAGGTQLAGTAGCDITARTWQQTSPGLCPSSLWRFTHRGDGTYEAKEEGCGNVTGTATYDGTTLLVDFQYGGEGTGRYAWPLDGQCQGAAGTVTWSSGSLAGQSAATTLAPAP